MGGVRALARIHHPHQQLAALGVEQLGHAAHPEQIGLLADHLTGDVDGDLGGQQIPQLGVWPGQVEVGDGGLHPQHAGAGGSGNPDAVIQQLALEGGVVVAADLVLLVGGQQVPLAVLLADELQGIEQHLLVLAQVHAGLLVDALVGVAFTLLEGGQRDRLQAVGDLVLHRAATQQNGHHARDYGSLHLLLLIALLIRPWHPLRRAWQER